MNRRWTIYIDLEDAGSAVIQNGELFVEQPGGTYIHVGKVETVPPKRDAVQIKETGVLAVPMPEERKRRELDLAELMAQTIEDILGDKTIGWEAAAKLVKAIARAYPELLDHGITTGTLSECEYQEDSNNGDGLKMRRAQ